MIPNADPQPKKGEMQELRRVTGSAMTGMTKIEMINVLRFRVLRVI